MVHTVRFSQLNVRPSSRLRVSAYGCSVSGRWILALYDYLLVKEGRRSAPPSHALDPASLSSARRGRDRGRVNRPAPNGSSRVRPSRSLSSARRGRPVEALQPKPREGSRGFDTKAADGCLEGSFREVGRESRGETHEVGSGSSP